MRATDKSASRVIRSFILVFSAVAALVWASTEDAGAEDATARHGIAMHDAPALPPDFAHLPYADPAAPVGGRITLGERGSFDSLNPYAAIRGAPWHLRFNTFESLMTRSWDEPFTLYGLIAETVATPADRSYVEFTLRPEARFSNGAPITVEDVAWTWRQLRDEGPANQRDYYARVERVEIIDERTIRFVFNVPDREMPMIIGLMPVLPQAVYEDVDFSVGTMMTPVGSGPYTVEVLEAGSALRYRRNPDYWGWGLPITAGRHNFETIDYIYFRDRTALLEAFIAGAIDFYVDGDPAHWAEAYDAPGLADGRVARAEIERAVPSGLHGFVFNTRRDIFADRRVREAIALTFDFKWLNARAYGGGYTHSTSLFSASPLGFSGPATGVEAALLQPFADTLPEGTLEAGWTPPAGAGDGVNRRNLRQAQRLLLEAGWRFENGVLVDADGAPFTFEILLLSGGDDEGPAIHLQDRLKELGITAEIRVVDGALYRSLIRQFDYDMMVWRYGVSLSPGNEQRQYWGSEHRAIEGSRNYAGVADPAVDAMIEALLAAGSREEFEAAARALDRALMSGVYFIPFGHLSTDRVAYDATLRRPARDASAGFVYLDTWWRAPE